MVHALNKTIAKRLGFRETVEGPRVGLEIECEGTRLPTALMSYYNVHNDGSLRPYEGHPPQEYVFKKPILFPAAEKAVNYLDRKIKANGCQLFADSPRTSVHVHVNVNDMTAREFVNFAMLYTMYEEPLVEWCGPERVANLFCLRAVDAQHNIDVLTRFVAGEADLHDFRDDRRYAAMNLAATPKFGSVEFRSLRGTTDPNIINPWVGTLITLRDAATSGVVGRNPVEIYQCFREKGPRGFTSALLGKLPVVPPLHMAHDPSPMLRGLHMFGPVVGAVDWDEVGFEKATAAAPGAPVHEEPPDSFYSFRLNNWERRIIWEALINTPLDPQEHIVRLPLRTATEVAGGVFREIWVAYGGVFTYTKAVGNRVQSSVALASPVAQIIFMRSGGVFRAIAATGPTDLSSDYFHSLNGLERE